MRKFFQHLAGISLLALGMLWVNPQAHSVEIGVGARMGLGAGLTTYWPSDDIAMLQFVAKGIKPNDVVMVGLNGGEFRLSVGAYADIRFLDWLSVSPNVQASFALTRGGHGNLLLDPDHNDGVGSPVELSHTIIDFDLLAKFHVGWWYLGIGPGLTINTAPKLTMDEDLRAILDILNVIPESKATVGFNIVLDTGLYIPLGSNAHNITVGLRTTLDVIGLNFWVKNVHIKTNGQGLPADGIPEEVSKNLLGYTPFSIGLTVGYLYRFQ